MLARFGNLRRLQIESIFFHELVDILSEFRRLLFTDVDVINLIMDDIVNSLIIVCYLSLFAASTDSMGHCYVRHNMNFETERQEQLPNLLEYQYSGLYQVCEHLTQTLCCEFEDSLC